MQTVFGEGRAHARLFLVGEQPGDTEDKQGHPFVGPAGRVLQSSILRAPDDERRHEQMRQVIEDLRAARAAAVA